MMRLKTQSLFRDEHGFTTTSMVLSLLITLSLIFTAAQVYRINSASAQVQDVADAAALAAETQVAEFMILARFCDATILSLTLTGLTTCGLGVAALCTPVTAPFSEKLISFGKHLIQMRDKFAERSVEVLNKLQEALPFFSAACAAQVAQANNVAQSGANYLGVALLVPAKGELLSVSPSDTAKELLDDIESQADEIRTKAREAEEASQQANRAKERAFMRDCGDNPSYCMYERAAHLAGLSGGSNPLYTSVDAWSFQVGLDRAKRYYRQRLRQEAPANASLDEQARSSLRARYYRFVVRELNSAYVHDSEDSFDAYIPHVPSNTSEMRLTTLYTDAVYPITSSESGQSVMHAWTGCPEAAASLGRGSIQQMESGGFETCPTCRFSAASMGKVAAASSSISNGFEYHYEAFADEAAVYQEARHRADVPKSSVKRKTGALFEKLKEIAKDTVNKRIEPAPPGKYGCVAFVVNASSTSAAGGFVSSFVAGSYSLGPRAAVAASTLVDEGSDEGKTVINSALDNLKENGGIATGAAGIVLDVWSWLLSTYSKGQDALLGAVESGLNTLPLASESGLGSWASKKLKSAIEDVGLQPAKIGALKPVLVNSAHVAAKGEGSFASGFVSIKQHLVAHPLVSTDLFSALLTEAERTALSQVESLPQHIEIASIELLGDGGISIPITIPLPEAARNQGIAGIQSLFDRIRSYYIEITGVRVWE